MNTRGLFYPGQIARSAKESCHAGRVRCDDDYRGGERVQTGISSARRLHLRTLFPDGIVVWAVNCHATAATPDAIRYCGWRYLPCAKADRGISRYSSGQGLFCISAFDQRSYIRHRPDGYFMQADGCSSDPELSWPQHATDLCTAWHLDHVDADRREGHAPIIRGSPLAAAADGTAIGGWCACDPPDAWRFRYSLVVWD